MPEISCRLLEERCGTILKTSGIYETEPWGFECRESFYNQAVVIETPLSPLELLSTVLQIENELGRTRNPNQRYSSRSIDIDILFYDSEIIQTENLTIPHPLIRERNFVLIPLNEIVPDFLHPVFKKTVNELLLSSEDTLNVKKIS